MHTKRPAKNKRSETRSATVISSAIAIVFVGNRAAGFCLSQLYVEICQKYNRNLSTPHLDCGMVVRCKNQPLLCWFRTPKTVILV